MLIAAAILIAFFALILTLPPLPSAAPVVVILPAAVPVTFAPDKFTPPVLVIIAASIVTSPTLLPSASAFMVNAPVPSKVNAVSTLIFLFASNTKLLLTEPVAVKTLKALATIISLVAWSVIVLPADIPEKLPPEPTLKTLFKPASSVKACVLSEPAVKPKVFVSLLLSVIFNGSSNKLPPTPFAALKSTLPKKLSKRLPEISTNPPLPEIAPPFAETLP